jgi:hypothetical protein
MSKVESQRASGDARSTGPVFPLSREPDAVLWNRLPRRHASVSGVWLRQTPCYSLVHLCVPGRVGSKMRAHLTVRQSHLPAVNYTRGTPINYTRGPPINYTRGPPINYTRGAPINYTRGIPINYTRDIFSTGGDPKWFRKWFSAWAFYKHKLCRTNPVQYIRSRWLDPLSGSTQARAQPQEGLPPPRARSEVLCK